MVRQYVIFSLNEEEYGVAIENVREITEHKNTTTLPNAPEFIEGVIDIRGNITPIISLKKRFKLEYQEDKKEDRIIIIKIDENQIGFLVDDASQVLTLDEDQIENPPEIITKVTGDYIIGVGKIEEKIILLLDLEKVLTKEEREKVIDIELV